MIVKFLTPTRRTRESYNRTVEIGWERVRAESFSLIENQTPTRQYSVLQMAWHLTHPIALRTLASQDCRLYRVLRSAEIDISEHWKHR